MILATNEEFVFTRIHLFPRCIANLNWARFYLNEGRELASSIERAEAEDAVTLELM